jgi:hypothetical protein
MKIDEERRREWLRALRKWKYGIKVRAKLGVLKPICEEVARDRSLSSVWTMPDWNTEPWLTLLYESIRDEQFSPRILRAFAESAEVTFLAKLQQPTPERIVEGVDRICKTYSRRLRDKFGVFIWDHHGQAEETEEEVPPTGSP